MIFIKYAFLNISEKRIFNVLIMIEIALIIVVINFATAAANSRNVYYEPFSDIINKDGFVVRTKAKGLEYDKEMRVKATYDSLKGDITVVNTYKTTTYIGKDIYMASHNDNEEYDPEKLLNLKVDDFVFNTIEGSCTLVSYDESIYKKFRIPLSGGRWADTNKTKDGFIEAVLVQSDYPGDLLFVDSLQLGKEFYCMHGKIRIVGVIDRLSYYPAAEKFTPSVETDHSVIDMYETATKTPVLIVSQSADISLSDPHNLGTTPAFVYYNSEPDEETRLYNEQVLERLSRCNLSEIKRNSDIYLYEEYFKLWPIMLCVFIIVLGELICSVAMNTDSQLRNFGIYFLCGCRWRDVLRISLSYSLIILAGGLMLGGAAMAVFQTTEYAKMFEQNLALNNVWMTLALIGFMLIVSLIIPFVQVSRTSPVSTIKESA